MMKKLFFLLVFLFFFTEISAQVGINTSTPVRGVHVGGAVENVRVEGLNAVNNSDNLGSASTSRVYVDANGDLVLGDEEDVNVAFLVDSDNYLKNVENPTSIVVQTGNNFGYNIAGDPVLGIVGASFTLTQNAILEINYSVSWSIYDANSLDKKRLDDLRARVVQTGIFFIDTATEVAIINDVDGNPINGGPWCIDTNSAGTGCLQYGGLLGLTGQFYNNGNAERGAYNNFRNTASDYVKLGPGTYTALFAARVQVEVTTGAGAAKLYLGSGNDTLQIIAYYYE
jgi:hypothetical protein